MTLNLGGQTMKRMRSFTAIVAGLGAVLLLIALNQPAQADPGDVLVDRASGIDQPGCGDGSNPPCYSMKYAVESEAAWGDRVLVAPGTYTETFDMQSGVSIIGTSGRHVTIIDGEGERGPMVNALDASITETAGLEGFTVTGGHGGTGAAIQINGASPVISDCVLFDNDGTDGGAVSIRGSSSDVLISGSDIVSNTSSNGAAGILVAD
jgi:hypothetical protein